MRRIAIILFIGGFILLAGLNVDAEVKNPNTFILATYGTLRTLDPAACYDTTGSQRIWNLYETLVFFDGSSRPLDVIAGRGGVERATGDGFGEIQPFRCLRQPIFVE